MRERERERQLRKDGRKPPFPNIAKLTKSFANSESTDLLEK